MNETPDILFADRHLAVVIKPARLPVASDKSGDETLLERIRAWNAARQTEGKKGYCVPIHFLDRPVSGVMVFGLSSKGAARLNEQFRNRSISKRYVALVHGTPPQAQGVLEHWLDKDHDTNVSRLAKPGARDAKRCRLSYRVLARAGERSLLLVEPETGRSHQIRVQLAAIGCPILGDVKYGAQEAWEHRIALHAWQLAFEHPVEKRPMSLEAPIPDEWRKLWPSPWPDLTRLDNKP